MSQPIRMLAALVILAAFVSCGPRLPGVRSSDAGDYSWVRQIVPKLTGRKTGGYAEVKVLADLIAQTDRPTVLKAVLQHPQMRREFIDHWSENLVDFMRVHRETAKAQTGTGMCFGPGTRAPADYTDSLARFVRDNGPLASAPPGGPFNITDLLRSALALDDVSPAYRAYLFSMVSKPISGAEITQQNQRDDHGATFTRVFTHRQLLCLGCHTTTASASGPDTFWNRHWPIRGRFSEAMFGSGAGRPSDEVHAMLRTDVFGLTPPWAMQACGMFVQPTSVPADTLTSPGGTPIQSFFIQSHSTHGSVWDLEADLRSGNQTVTTAGLVRGLPTGSSATQCNYCNGTCPTGSGTTVPPLDTVGTAREQAAQTALSNNGCFTCHANGLGQLFMTAASWRQNTVGKPADRNPGKLRVNPGNAPLSYLMDKLDAPNPTLADGSQRMPPAPAGQMPAGTAANPGRDAIRAWINGLASVAGCPACAPPGSAACDTDYVNGPAAFAFQTAGRVVENTWNEIAGAPLTIPNYFPRNVDQRDILWTLTETQFVPSRWSLQALLTRILTSDFFNRQSPEQSTGPSAYELPAYIDPWVAADPRVPPVALPGTPPASGLTPTRDPAYDPNTEANRPHVYNSMGDGVHRYSPRSLLYSVHRALGWPAPPRDQSANYPGDDLRKAIGEFYRDAEPGFREMGFQSLLGWEGAHGTCTKPTNQSGDDWIDVLVSRIQTFNTANPTSRATLRDVVITVKDRILADPSLQTTMPTGAPSTETVAVEALFGAALTTEVDASAAGAATLKLKIRAYCGVLLESPQFLLAGIAPTKLGERPRVPACLPGEPCGYQNVCSTFVSTLSSLGFDLTCRDDSLEVKPKPTFPRPNLDDFCPKGRCGVVPFDVLELNECLRRPDLCLRRPAPPCDPRCQRIDCCGGPLSPIAGKELFLFWADQGRIEAADGVQILRAGKSQLEPLARGDSVRTGEVLVVPGEGRLKIATREGGFETPKGGLGPRAGQKVWLVQITGEQALTRALPAGLARFSIADGLEYSNTAYWLRGGEAGAPTIPRQPKAPSMVPGRARRPAPTPAGPDFEIGPRESPTGKPPGAGR